MSLRVLEPGAFSTIQDPGRIGRRGLGVPWGGAADKWSAAIGNALVGNPPQTPVLEIALLGPVLEAETDTLAALAGAPFEATLGSHRIPFGSSFEWPAGRVLRIRGTPTGMRGYLCIAGGIDAPRVLGSVSSEEPLRTGVVLSTRAAVFDRRIAGRRAAECFDWDAESTVLRVLPGDHRDLFDRPGDLFAGDYTVAPQSDRMGLRLSGPALSRRPAELMSEPVCPGTVQVTNDGSPIILGAACQTIGGYPRIAQVIRADLDKLGRLRPGAAIRFRETNLDEARRVEVDKQRELWSWIRRLG